MPPDVMQVQAKGQVTIDRRARAELGIEPGDEVVWVKNRENRWEIWKAQDLGDAFDDAATGIGAFSARAKRGYGRRRP